ncbi:MAG: serine hydroxymethyltransferase, partial [Fibromonadales bacterium]|nr:serine hydroxymethyltransferase [Fibromonadales bacterium]
VIENAQAMAAQLMKAGFKVISDGTDNHLMVVDVTSRGISGKDAERVLDLAGISTSRSTIPFDPRKPMDPSGIRLGTPSITTRGFDTLDTCKVADFITQAIENPSDEAKLKSIREGILELCKKRPLYKTMT